ncbi:MAG: dockerin type I repeat-containing protein, partial [Oscillospiraceae bacterium]|nr:dockerin type I repeat-containing protein [Oscillospiraceae bacterium]
MRNRKILGMITAICLLSGSAIAPFSAFAEDSAAPLIGDANLDQMVDVADAVLIARYYAEDATANLTDAGKKNADVNTDGNVDNRDLLQIMEFIARKRTSFTAEK